MVGAHPSGHGDQWLRRFRASRRICDARRVGVTVAIGTARRPSARPNVTMRGFRDRFNCPTNGDKRGDECENSGNRQYDEHKRIHGRSFRRRFLFRL